MEIGRVRICFAKDLGSNIDRGTTFTIQYTTRHNPNENFKTLFLQLSVLLIETVPAILQLMQGLPWYRCKT